jgi:CDP-2,3-bis-(O-geranylgeranyl)-sn-glycerol synthase
MAGSAILLIWWYFLPAMVVNLVLYLTGLWFGQASILPLDLRLEVGGRRLVGDGRGLTSLAWAPVLAALCAWAQGRGTETLTLALGSHFGMIATSVVKRRLGLPRGAPWHPWDHVDFVLGAVVFQACSGGLDWRLAGGGLLVCGLTHCCVGNAIKSILGDR